MGVTNLLEACQKVVEKHCRDDVYGADWTSAVGTGPLPTWQSNTEHYNFFQNIIKFVYETNNTFVTWNTHINLKKTFMGIKTVINLYPKSQNNNINERNV